MNSGAIAAKGISIKGCTFYGNSSAYMNGAINGGALEGNLFYGNTAPSWPVSRDSFSNGYNVVDVPLGTRNTQSGWEAATGDATFSSLGISGAPVNTVTFAPVSGLGSVIPSAPTGFPTTDFYGNTRTWPGAPGAVK